jgi:hypothetical protein
MSSVESVKKEKTSKTMSRWWWVVFLPYAVYHFVRYSPKKWYVKVPVVLVVAFVLLVSVDLALSPNRVEEAEAKQAISSFVEEEGVLGELQKVERLGEGVSLQGKEQQTLVYYRTLTESGLYHFGLSSKDGKALNVQHVEQLFPIRIDIKDSGERTKAEVAVWLKQHQEEIGKAKELVESSDEELSQTVKTDKGIFEFKIGNQSVYEVNRIDKKESILKRANEPVLPAIMLDYLAKNEEKIGKLTRSLAYEMDDSKEKYYFRTSTGDFLAEINHDGSINIKKRKE